MGSTSSSVSSGWSDSEADDFFYDTGSSSSWETSSPSPPSSCAERSSSESEVFDSEVLVDDLVFYTISTLPPYREKVTVRSRLKRRMNQAPQEQNYEVADHNSWRGLDHETFLNPGALIRSVDTTSSSSSQVACSTSSYSETPATSDVPKVSPSESEGSEASHLVSDAAVLLTPQRKRVRRTSEEEEEEEQDQPGAN